MEILIYILLTNIFSFILFGIDKFKAVYNRFRIREKTLLTFSFFGGFGALIGMKTFSHKTNNLKFKFLVSVFCILNSIFYIFLFLIK